MNKHITVVETSEFVKFAKQYLSDAAKNEYAKLLKKLAECYGEQKND